MRTFLQVALLLLLTVPGQAQSEVERLFARAYRLNASMRDLSATIEIQLDGKVGPLPYKQTLKGRYLFKRADKHKLELPDAPSFLKKYGSVFGVHLPRLERYNASVEGMVTANGRRLKKVVLVPKAHTNDIEQLVLYIDPERGTVPKYDTIYSKGHLYVDIDYVQKEKFWVYDRMRADIALPNVAAKASAGYGGYQFNQNLPDSLFQNG